MSKIHMAKGKTLTKSNRNSSIELLKIFAILLIILSHVMQTLISKNYYINYSDYILNIRPASTSINNFILVLMRHGGIIGNNIFFICSAWYFVDKNKNNVEKIIHMIADVWVISMLWLCFTHFDNTVVKIDKTLLIEELFPLTFSNNWYVTAYVLFCFLHVALNKYIALLDRRMHFRVMLALTMLYIVINYFVGFVSNSYAFQGSTLVLWVTIYFIISYIRRFDIKIFDNKKFNIIISIIGIAGLVGILAITNASGLKGDFSKYRILNWNTNCSIFALMLCFGLFNLARNHVMKSRIVNYISSLSLLVYIIHENLLFRTYYRPLIWHKIYVQYGYDNVILWVLLQVVVIFAASLALSALYQLTIQRLTALFCSKAVPYLGKLYMSFENKIIKNRR